MTIREKYVRRVAWFLAISYGIAGPACAVLEYRDQVISRRFDLPPELIYLTCVLHILCAIGVLIRRFAPWAAAGLVFVTLGAIGAHLRIGSPLTTVPAILYTVLQMWFGTNCRRTTAS